MGYNVGMLLHEPLVWKRRDISGYVRAHKVFLLFVERRLDGANPGFSSWQVGQESNLQPAVLETAALPN